MTRSLTRIAGSLFATGALLFSGLAQAQDAKERNLRVAFVQVKEHPHGAGAQKFAELVNQKSGGKIKVGVFGTIDMTMESPGLLVGMAKEFGALDLPFLFGDYKEVDAVLDGPVGRKLLERLPEKGLIGLGYWDHGFRNLTNSRRPVAKLEDIQGLKIRVIQIPIFIEMFNALGANAVPMGFPEL